MLRRLSFNLWYFRNPPWDSGISPPELLEFIQTHPAGKAIDLGCGTGTNVITLARVGWKVTGIDFAIPAIQMAKSKIKQAKVHAEFYVGDVTKLKVTDSFDLALDLGCFHGLTQQGRDDYLNQLDRILAPNGFWLLYAFLSPGTRRSGHGLAEAEIASISARFSLLSRRNGNDTGRGGASAWFLFQKSAVN